MLVDLFFADTGRGIGTRAPDAIDFALKGMGFHGTGRAPLGAFREILSGLARRHQGSAASVTSATLTTSGHTVRPAGLPPRRGGPRLSRRPGDDGDRAVAGSTDT